MDKTIVIGLNGHAGRYRLEEDAYDQLARYLDRAASRLQDDSEQAEVLGDLERSVGDKLDALLGSDDRVVTSAEIDGILEEIGAVDTGDAEEDEWRPRGRRLYRIREGQKVAGVCTGLAAYANMGVDWVRTLFLFATVVTAGIFALVYIALAYILPVVDRAGMRPRPRRLYRIRQGQKIAGVCAGLAAYAELDVDWTRTLFLFATVVTAGIFALVYMALAFALPVTATRESYHVERP
jgi:phage shock protein PspC (stress-responsive transcriptional regulator)